MVQFDKLELVCIAGYYVNFSFNNVYTDRIHYGILLQNICTGLDVFWEDFPKKQKIPSETWTHPPSSSCYYDVQFHYNIDNTFICIA